MSKLVWDNTGERFYEMGVSHGVLYTQKTDGTYNAGVAWNGLTAVTESPDGAEPTDLWADNIKYASLRSAETFGGTIEAYMAPPEWDACDGFATPVTGVQIAQQNRAPFGLCYRTEVGNDTFSESDDGYKLHLVYNASASPSERAYETLNDGPDAITFSWDFETTPVVLDGFKPTAHIIIDTTKLDAAGKTALVSLESTLYGSTNAEPTLPTPMEVLTAMGYSAA